jgi:hypothetical protein
VVLTTFRSRRDLEDSEYAARSGKRRNSIKTVVLSLVIQEINRKYATEYLEVLHKNMLFCLERMATKAYCGISPPGFLRYRFDRQ